MMQSSQRRHDPTTGREPQLGGDNAPDLTGFEPMLGGIRRAEADMTRVLAIVSAETEAERARLLDTINRLGQTDAYAAELAQVVPARARVKMGNWRGSFTPGQRCGAMDTLAEIGGYESVVPLLEALSDDSYQIRKAAERALTTICARFDPADRRTQIVYHALVEALQARPLSARKVAARILADAPPDLVLGPLLRDGLTMDVWWARREAAWVLGALGDRRAARSLIEMLDDSSHAVRASAAWALGQLDAPIAVEPLAELTEAERDEVVRAAAVEALGEQAGRLSLLDDALDVAIRHMIAALKDPDISVRHAALEALAPLNERPEARQALRSYLNH